MRFERHIIFRIAALLVGVGILAAAVLTRLALRRYRASPLYSANRPY